MGAENARHSPHERSQVDILDAQKRIEQRGAFVCYSVAGLHHRFVPWHSWIRNGQTGLRTGSGNEHALCGVTGTWSDPKTIESVEFL